jgi:DHA3 family macrolide efflux protein-like MFS transporter
MRSFFIIWLGQAFSRLGSQIVQFTLIWYLTNTTGSATVLAIASMVGLLPQITLGPLAGTLVDRWDRRKVLIFADGIIAVATVILALLFAFGWVQIWYIYSLMFIRALGGHFTHPQ